MNQPMPDRMIEKFEREMQNLLRHEDILKERRKHNEQKLETIFERDHMIDAKNKSIHEQILSSRIQNEQQKIQKQRLDNYQELKNQRQSKIQAAKELQVAEQIQHDKELQQKMFEIQTKINYEEFRKRTDELINQLDNNLRIQNNIYLQKAANKEKYFDEFYMQKEQNLNQSQINNTQQYHKVLSNYQQQMQRIQEICQQKLNKYTGRVNAINKQKQLQLDVAQQKALMNQEHINQIQYKHSKIESAKMQQYQKKIQQIQQKIEQIEKMRIRNFQVNQMTEQSNTEKRMEARAKSENFYRNKSYNILQKQQQKDRSFQMVQDYNSLKMSEKLNQLSQRWLTNQKQAQNAEQLKQSYLQQLEQRIQEKESRLQDQINGKMQIQRQRLKLIEDMEKQKRTLLSKLEADKIPIVSTQEMSYLYTPNKQKGSSKLFIT